VRRYQLLNNRRAQSLFKPSSIHRTRPCAPCNHHVAVLLSSFRAHLSVNAIGWLAMWYLNYWRLYNKHSSSDHTNKRHVMLMLAARATCDKKSQRAQTNIGRFGVLGCREVTIWWNENRFPSTGCRSALIVLLFPTYHRNFRRNCIYLIENYMMRAFARSIRFMTCTFVRAVKNIVHNLCWSAT